MSLSTEPVFRPVRGGFLVQEPALFVPWFERDQEFVRAPEQLPAHVIADMALGWAVGSTSNSNTIVLTRDAMTIGVAVGQQSRVGAAELAVTRAVGAGHSTWGAVAYSDSFFPFTDGPQYLIECGVAAIFATHGSVRDAEVRDLLQSGGTAFWTLPDSKARGFYGH